jgi:hypothetical protein
VTHEHAPTSPLIGVVSPYHLTTREPACAAALLLCDRCVTLIPTPPGPADRTKRLARAVPRFVEMMETWRWSTPLWSSGVLASAFEGTDACADVETARRAIATDAALSVVRGLAGLDDAPTDPDPVRMLDAIARDVLRSGPDPAISLPVAAGLDAFAARHGLVTFRSHAQSLAQQAEAALARPLCAAALPLLARCSAARLAEARDRLSEPLATLRAAVRDAFEARGAPGRTLRECARAYAAAFDAAGPDLLRPEDDDDLPRVRAGEAALSLVILPHDAVLRSACAAADRAVARSPRALGTAVADASATIAPIAAGAPVWSVIVRPLGV